MLDWARQSGCRWDERTCSWAAQGGHLAVLQWARQNGYVWSEDTCTLAAEGGRLAVLQWAHENNCPWSGLTTFAAALNNHLDILTWARQRQPPCPRWSLDELIHESLMPSPAPCRGLRNRAHLCQMKPLAEPAALPRR